MKEISLTQKIDGLDRKSARALAGLSVATLEALRDADLDFILEKKNGLTWEVLQRWQQQARLQTVFAGMTPRAAKILVEAGITSIKQMAEADESRLRRKLPAARLRAWKFIANKIPPHLISERLETARDIEPLPPPQAVALYAQGIKTLHQLRDGDIAALNFSLLPGINKREFRLYQYLAALRLDFRIGPAYAFQLYRRHQGRRDKIHARLKRELDKLPRPRGSSAPDVDFYLEPICRSLAATIGHNQRQAGRDLKRAQHWGSAQEISEKLVRSMSEDRRADKEAIFSWMLERGLTSKRGLLDLINQTVESQAGKENLIGALAEQWGLGSLAHFGKDSHLKNILGTVLADKLKQTAANWSKASPEAMKLLKLGSEAAAALMQQFDLQPEKLISAVLQSGERDKETGLSAVLSCFQDQARLDQVKNSTIFELYKEQAQQIQPFLRHLFKSGLEPLHKLESLFDISLSQPAQDRDGIFSSVFKAVWDFAGETENGFDTIMPKLLDWVRRANEKDFAPAVDDFLLPENQDAAEVPLGVHLLGKGVQALMSGANGDRAATDRFAEKFFQYLPLNDETEQEIWLHLAKIPGMLFVFLSQMLLKAVVTPMKVFQWIGKDIKTIEQKDRKLAIKELDPPDEKKGCKYVIISDIHRDVPEDDVVDEHFFDLAHFSKHRDLFIRLLEYYRDHGYTVIENGDCEELWVVPSVRKNKGVRARAERIIARDGPHHRVYEILAELHRQGRYFRTRGNHDDFWAVDEENLALLRDTWFKNGPAFRVWDLLIIPQVLTMHDDYLGVIKKIIRAKRDKKEIDVKELADLLPIGLSPRRYRERKPLVILHGHQIDFWNCDEHGFLGKTLANSIGIIADGISTFPYHLRGIDLNGNPLVKFSDLMAKVPQVEHWLPEDRALRLARRIEQSEEDRLIQDSIYFSETLAAALSLALRDPGQHAIQEVQIMMGHTHWPQSRPDLHLGTLNIPDTDKTIPLRLPTPYYNTGTCGWWEGVLWGIEITGFGQPKLFYWDKSSQAPNFMPWELHDEIPHYVGKFKEKIGRFLSKCFNQTAVLEERTQNRMRWEEVDDFSDLRAIDFSALDATLHGAAMNTAQIWALRHLENKPKTSETLALSFALRGLFAPETAQQKFSVLAEKTPGMNLLAALIEKLGVGKNWQKLDPQHAWYHQIGAIFFYAAHFLKNSLCNKLGLLLNLFISKEKEMMIKFDSQKGIFSIKLGKLE